MAKTKESAKEKNERQKALTKERVRRFRERLTAEKLEEKRKYDRDRYKKLKEEKKIKPVDEMTEREKREVRRKWKAQNKRKKERRAQLKLAVVNTPPPSPQPGMSHDADSSQKKRGRKAVRKDRAKAYRTLKKQNAYIEKLKRKVEKYKKRLQRERKKIVGSPSPMKLVRQLVGPSNVSPAVKKQLFLGFTLKKQLESKAKEVSGSKKKNQQFRKSIGNKVLKKYRVQGHFTKIVPYKGNRVIATNPDPCIYTKKERLGVRQSQAKALYNFFLDDSVSKMCPGKRDVVKVGQVKKQRRILLDTLTNLHKKYVEETNNKISIASFNRSKPKWVQPPKKSDRETCACLKHANMEFLIDALRKPKIIKEKNITELMASVVCSAKQESCMMGSCSICKEKRVKFSYTDDFKVKFFKWANIKEERLIKNKTKIIQKTIKLKTIKPVTYVIDLFQRELIEFKKHLFYAIHQHSQLKNKLNQLGDNELLFRVDFAENYVAKFSTEVQAMHFGASKRQISMHTGLRYAKVNGKMKIFCFCTASDHLDHQSHAIWAHLNPILKQSSTEFPQTTTVHFFSDSPSSQYRNRNNIHFFKQTLIEIFPKITKFSWNFTEAGHGKGPMDGVGGTLKREADKMVAHGADIKNASDFIEAHKKTKIFMLEIKSEIVDEMRETVINTIVPPIQGILKARQITFSVKAGRMYANRLTCFSCSFSKVCIHYNLFEVFPELHPKPKPRKRILSVEEVYGMTSEDEDLDNEENDMPLAQQLSDNVIEEPQTSNYVTESSLEELRDKIKQGVFVVVKFDTSKKSHLFLGVCQGAVTNDELQVLFMKNCDKDKSTFYPNEADVSFIQLKQIISFPPQPKLIMKGNRVFYRFSKNPIVE